ncbi:MAG TPA: GMC oxidoreductase, partial [Polyangiaceae bacterium]
MLKKLFEGSETAAVQRTRFGVDVVGRYVCNTLDEALESGSFDVVVVGSGMYGAHFAQQVAQDGAGKNARVLVLEAGPFLVSEHVQNLAMLGLNVPGEIEPSSDPGVAREQVWGIPWRGNVSFPGLAFCVGGKSLYWGGWCPRLTSGDLAGWPAGVAAELSGLYATLERETGVVPGVDFIQGPLHAALKSRFEAAAATVANLEVLPGTVNGVSDAPLAVQGSPPASGLFSFDKFSSAPVLVTAIRNDVASAGVDANRRLMLVPNTRVLRLNVDSGRVWGLEVAELGARRTVPLSSRGRVVLAASAIESTRLALESFPSAPMGRNLMVHLRSDLTVRIRRSAFGALPELQTSALLVRGLSGGRRFHLQVVAVGSRSGNPEESLFRMVPDIETLDHLLGTLDSEWITIVLRSVGETVGDRVTAVPNAGGSWIDLSPFERDEFGMRRAWVKLESTTEDHALWQAMESASLALAAAVAQAPGNIEYLHPNGWQVFPPNVAQAFPPWRRGLGSTYHESGTLWMGTDSASSVTNADARFHHVTNAYACDQSIFPTVGSVNP